MRTGEKRENAYPGMDYSGFDIPMLRARSALRGPRCEPNNFSGHRKFFWGL